MKRTQTFNHTESSSYPGSDDSLILADNVSFAYPASDGSSSDIVALKNVSIKINKGKHVAILGRNGSGKSTLAKLINALEIPDQGKVIVFGHDTSDKSSLWSVRQACGMVFQNPDNQIVGTTVEEDVAFGPENLGVPSDDIRCRVDRSLSRVGLEQYALKAPSQLSGGQKQKLAIAGILAMQPDCVILDEATSMLDPKSAKDFLKLIKELQQEFSMTVVEITHDIENAVTADYIYIMQQGEIFFSGTPREVFTRPDKVLSAGLDLPQHLYINYLFQNSFSHEALESLHEKHPDDIFTPEETVDAMFELQNIASPQTITSPAKKYSYSNQTLISVEKLSYTYQKGTEFAVDALKEVSFQVEQGEMIAIVGHSGSGKSTLISHLNGLFVPQTGQVEVMNLNTRNKKNIREIRKFLGLLFQYPEHQLFENTVYEDIAFGPKQFGFSESEIEKNIKQAIDIVGLSQDILQRSPFELSGGQQRRVAIAGVLATDCEIFVLDEPAAGLDPIGQQEIINYIMHLQKLRKTVILVTHDMKLAARADRILVLNEGSVAAYDTAENIFSNQKILTAAGLEVPPAYKFARLISEKFSCEIDGYTAEDVNYNLLKHLNNRRQSNA
ncbi:MAG TPA: energy-coupling factor transporter ATPase [Clostridiaceae bacterium]|nr:energy-coupling factor transporter ATPase [Clostridiaceae bacterium]